MNNYEIKQKLFSIPGSVIPSLILAFSNWQDPSDFYTLSTSERRALLNKYRAVSEEPSSENQWIWFGAYDIKGYPKFARTSIATYLYNLVIKPTNGARIRGVLNTSKSDVNPFKYFEALNMTPMEVLKLRSSNLDIPLNELMTTRQNEAFENKVIAALNECKEYYMVGSPTETREFMKNLLIQNNHMPLAVDEAMARSGLEFKD